MAITPCTDSTISAVVPAHRNLDSLLRTLSFLFTCNPGPAEILVHVDGGSDEILSAIRTQYPTVRLLASHELLGPGGSRNQLIAAAKHEWVANFDDDSFPAHLDYFARVTALIEAFPQAAILSAASHSAEWQSLNIKSVGIFSGCGCVFRKSWFEGIDGFVPLPIAYGMEEVDLSLQIHAAGGLIVHDPLLRVQHESLPGRLRDHQTISATALANTLLFAYLRYPWWLLGLGLCQALRRMVWMVRHEKGFAILPGLKQTPLYLWKHRAYRSPVSFQSLLSWHKLRRHPKTLEDGTQIANAWRNSVPSLG